MIEIPTFRSLHLHFSQNRLESEFAKHNLFVALQYKPVQWDGHSANEQISLNVSKKDQLKGPLTSICYASTYEETVAPGRVGSRGRAG